MKVIHTKINSIKNLLLLYIIRFKVLDKKTILKLCLSVKNKNVWKTLSEIVIRNI